MLNMFSHHLSWARSNINWKKIRISSKHSTLTHLKNLKRTSQLHSWNQDELVESFHYDRTALWSSIALGCWLLFTYQSIQQTYILSSTFKYTFHRWVAFKNGGGALYFLKRSWGCWSTSQNIPSIYSNHRGTWFQQTHICWRNLHSLSSKSKHHQHNSAKHSHSEFQYGPFLSNSQKEFSIKRKIKHKTRLFYTSPMHHANAMTTEWLKHWLLLTYLALFQLWCMASWMARNADWSFGLFEKETRI